MPLEAARFDPENPGEVVYLKQANGNFALKSQPTEGAKAEAIKLAKVWITGNTASNGGGIGSNGVVSAGEEDDGWSFKVTKQWGSTVADEDKKTITVNLLCGDNIIDTQELSEENGWTATFTNLANPARLDGEEYTVQEVGDLQNFKIVYGDKVTDEEIKTISQTILNTYEEDEPEDESGDESTTSEEQSPPDQKVISQTKTGDEIRFALAMAGMLIAVMTYAAIARKKERK